MKELFDLFWTFCKIGALTFGGGYAMLPLIQREIVENKKLLSCIYLSKYIKCFKEYNEKVIRTSK